LLLLLFERALGLLLALREGMAGQRPRAAAAARRAAPGPRARSQAKDADREVLSTPSTGMGSVLRYVWMYS